MVNRKDVKTEDIISLYNQGLIGKEVAEKLNCSISLVQQRLAQAGIKMRPSNERKKVEVPKEVLEDLYWKQEKHPSEIGKIYGLPFSAIVKKMKDFGIPLRTKSESRQGKLNPIYGVGHTAETKEKMSLLFLTGRRKVSKSNQYGNPTEYAGTTYRSTWEAGVAFFLHSTKVPFSYENNSFLYEDEKKSLRSYTPDFYLPEGIGEFSFPLYIEVKGRFMDRDHLKINSVRSQGYTVLLWDWPELQKLRIIDAAGKVVVGEGQLKKVGDL